MLNWWYVHRRLINLYFKVPLPSCVSGASANQLHLNIKKCYIMTYAKIWAILWNAQSTMVNELNIIGVIFQSAAKVFEGVFFGETWKIRRWTASIFSNNRPKSFEYVSSGSKRFTEKFLECVGYFFLQKSAFLLRSFTAVDRSVHYLSSRYLVHFTQIIPFRATDINLWACLCIFSMQWCCALALYAARIHWVLSLSGFVYSSKIDREAPQQRVCDVR